MKKLLIIMLLSIFLISISSLGFGQSSYDKSGRHVKPTPTPDRQPSPINPSTPTTSPTPKPNPRDPNLTPISKDKSTTEAGVSQGRQ
jgi:hypothetical protein